jgi:hypothetical protein
MKSAADIKQCFRKSTLRTNRARHEAIFAEILRAQEQSREIRPASARPINWSGIMRSPLTKLAMAAAVLIAGGIGLSFWRTTGSGIALADVLAQVEKARSFQCNWSVVMSSDAAPGKPSNSGERGTWLISKEWGVRHDRERMDPNGGQTPEAGSCFSLQKKTIIQIDLPSKRYTRMELDDATFRWMREGLTRPCDPEGFLKAIMKRKHESLGRSIVDGVEVEGFRTTDPNHGGFRAMITDPQVDVKLWVDVKTRMPVRVEQIASGFAKTGGRMSIQGVLDHIQWDVPLTGAEFEPSAVPEGYLIVVDKPPGPVTEEGTIEGLKQCVELLGQYPGSISVAPPEGIQSELDQSDSPAATRLKDELKAMTAQERINRLMEAGTPMRRVHRFFMGLVNDRKDPAYYGQTVTPKDADKVLLRWKVSDNEYRVIFGDLHAETVSPEKLAELEKALPK